ncbi:LysM peptidoglycan-binding domain-containing protein [Streptomyces sp. NPDC058279]|uniref:LysM peptidoglycan-binding domain-containing protein n=1 Tax=Streptomyces sp. NPDC058279 TaxID=3346418 RepID=UPI0036E327C1
MGIFDFLKSDKKRQEEAAEKAKEQVEQQTPARPTGPNDMGGKYTDAASSARAAAAPAPPKPAPGHVQHKTPTPASAAHKAVPAAPKPPSEAQRTYIVKTGDSLSAIARRELGNEGRWRELYAMNKSVVGPNPDMIRPGMVLMLPS